MSSSSDPSSLKRVVHDERVDRRCGGDRACRCVGLGEICDDVDRDVPAAEPVGHDARAAVLQAARDRKADARPAIDAGDERCPHYVVRTPTTSRTASEDAASACCSSPLRSSSMISSMPLGPSFTGTPM